MAPTRCGKVLDCCAYFQGANAAAASWTTPSGRKRTHRRPSWKVPAPPASMSWPASPTEAATSAGRLPRFRTRASVRAGPLRSERRGHCKTTYGWHSCRACGTGAMAQPSSARQSRKVRATATRTGPRRLSATRPSAPAGLATSASRTARARAPLRLPAPGAPLKMPAPVRSAAFARQPHRVVWRWLTALPLRAPFLGSSSPAQRSTARQVTTRICLTSWQTSRRLWPARWRLASAQRRCMAVHSAAAARTAPGRRRSWKTRVPVRVCQPSDALRVGVGRP